MKKTRRDFIKITGLAGIGMAGARLKAYGTVSASTNRFNKVTLDNAVAILEDGSALATPFWRVDSGKDGPSLLLIAAVHGNEVQGTEVARRFLDVCVRQLTAGIVWIVPMANLLAIRKRRYAANLKPGDPYQYGQRYNMEVVWPGNPNGNDNERVVYQLNQTVVRHCQHVIDLHCWNHFWAATTLLFGTESEIEATLPLEQVTKTRFTRHIIRTMPEPGNMNIRQMIRKRGGLSLAIELSGQFEMQEKQVQIGLDSMINIAKKLGMIKGEPELIKGPKVVWRDPNTNYEVRASDNGIFMPALRKDKRATINPEDYVEEGQLLGHILSESDLKTVPVVAPVSGYLWQFGTCHTFPGPDNQPFERPFTINCSTSLPGYHPYTEKDEIIAIVVTSSTFRKLTMS